MEENFGGCKECDEHRYWVHLDLTKFHFAKVMEHGFSQCMVVPNKFVKNFKGELSCDLELKGPSGNLWHIKLKKVKTDLVFRDGWREFVEDHHIEEGDLLVFKYDDNFRFTVLIFDPSGCEREAAHFSTVCKRSQANKGCNQEQDGMNTHDVYSSGVSAPGQFASSAANVANAPPRSSAVHHKRKAREEVIGRSSKRHVENNIKKQNPKGRQGHVEEKGARTSALASGLELTNPCFPIRIRSSHVNKKFFMAIPYNFLAEHLHHRPKIILLRLPNGEGSWLVRCGHNAHSWGFMGREWKKFVLDNNLEEGDTCVFELSGSYRNLKFDVYIFRNTEEDCSVKVES